MNYIEFDTVPLEEECVQLKKTGTDYDRMIAEANAFKGQLKRMFPPPPGCKIRVAAVPHDFGSYYEVRAYYNQNDEEATNWAYNIEANLPNHWDEEARKELEIHTAK